MTLENLVKIEGAMEQNIAVKLQSAKALKCKKLQAAIRGSKPQIFFGKKVFLGDPGYTLSDFEVKIKIYRQYFFFLEAQKLAEKQLTDVKTMAEEKCKIQ